MYFITGTDTNIGKTFISTILLRGARWKYFKPIQCGDLGCNEDISFVKKHSLLTDEHYIDTIYRLKQPLSPHEASFRENITISIDQIKKVIDQQHDDKILIEGAGGVLVPLNKDHLMIDLIKLIGCEAIIVTSPRLGTFNHTLLTVQALQHHNIPIKGIIINGFSEKYVVKTIEHFTHIPILAIVPWYESLTPFPDIDIDL